MDRVGKISVAVFAVVTIGLVGYVVYDSMVADTFSLRKDEWTCTASHVETYSTNVVIGNAVYPQTSAITICDRWERNSDKQQK